MIVVDYGKVPLDRTSDSFRHDESLQTHLEDAEEIVWERRDADGGGIIVHYISSLQEFHGTGQPGRAEGDFACRIHRFALFWALRSRHCPPTSPP